MCGRFVFLVDVLCFPSFLLVDKVGALWDKKTIFVVVHVVFVS